MLLSLPKCPILIFELFSFVQWVQVKFSEVQSMPEGATFSHTWTTWNWCFLLLHRADGPTTNSTSQQQPLIRVFSDDLTVKPCTVVTSSYHKGQPQPYQTGSSTREFYRKWFYTFISTCVIIQSWAINRSERSGESSSFLKEKSVHQRRLSANECKHNPKQRVL